MDKPDSATPIESPIEGYRQKPFWIYLVSALFILSPFVNFAFALKGRGEPGWLSPAVWLEWLPHTPPRSFLVSLILFVSGIWILRVNHWSWRMAITSLVILCGYNLLLIRGIVENNFWLLFLVSLLMAGFLLLLYQSTFREIFINPRLRWWESKPRFAVNLEVGIKGSRAHFILVDASKSGFLIRSKSKSFEPKENQAISITIAEGVAIPGTIVRITEDSDGYSMGVQIEKIGKYESRYLYNWIRILHKKSEKLR